MPANDSADTQTPDNAELARIVADISQRSQRLVEQFVQKQAEARPNLFQDPLGLSRAFMDLTARMIAQPEVVLKAQMDAWQSYMNIWHHTTRRMLGMESQAPVAPAPADRRFKHDAWTTNPVFDFIKPIP